jgi:hypothetical protein
MSAGARMRVTANGGPEESVNGARDILAYALQFQGLPITYYDSLTPSNGLAFFAGYYSIGGPLNAEGYHEWTLGGGVKLSGNFGADSGNFEFLHGTEAGAYPFVIHPLGEINYQPYWSYSFIPTVNGNFRLGYDLGAGDRDYGLFLTQASSCLFNCGIRLGGGNGFFDYSFTANVPFSIYISSSSRFGFAANQGGIDDFGSVDSFSYEVMGVYTFIPEPATWAMMIAGFGFVGGAMRRRTKVRVTFA